MLFKFVPGIRLLARGEMVVRFLLLFFASFYSLTEQERLPGRHHHILSRGHMIYYQPLSFDPQQNGKCGISEVAASRVVSGGDASLGEWPWQAWINFTNIGFICGGSLITPEWVLTASHCIIDKDKSKYMVTIGDVDRTKHEKSEQTFKIKWIIKHPMYGIDWPYNYDVALLRLSHKAKITPFVRPVCLPKVEEEVPLGSKCIITGWGQTFHPGSVVDVLQQAEMPVVSNRACAAKLDTSPNGGLHTDNRTWTVTSEMLCAGDAGRTKTNGCYGDSGGPFVCKTSGANWVLEGVVSWGDPDCSSSNHYSVFARVSRFILWIQQQINKYS